MSPGMFDYRKLVGLPEKPHHVKKSNPVHKSGRMKSATLGFTGYTFARPGTKEYRRFLALPQHPTHIKEIHKYMRLRIRLGTDNKHDS